MEIKFRYMRRRKFGDTAAESVVRWVSWGGVEVRLQVGPNVMLLLLFLWPMHIHQRRRWRRRQLIKYLNMLCTLFYSLDRYLLVALMMDGGTERPAEYNIPKHNKSSRCRCLLSIGHCSSRASLEYNLSLCTTPQQLLWPNICGDLGSSSSTIQMHV